MENILTGYQWGEDGSYIGPYSFHNNLDKEEVHLPPNTTLVPPPMVTESFKEAAWDGEKWFVRDELLGWMDSTTVQMMFLAGDISQEQIIAGFPK